MSNSMNNTYRNSFGTSPKSESRKNADSNAASNPNAVDRYAALEEAKKELANARHLVEVAEAKVEQAKQLLPT